jgi:hypothetical protein
MVNSEKEYVSFTHIDELEFHFNASIMLIERIKETVSLMAQSEGENRRELEESVTKSMGVLIDGFTAAIHSIQEGYIHPNPTK